MKIPTYKKVLTATAAAAMLSFVAACGGSSSDGAAASDPTASASASASTSTDAAATFKDGDYSGEGSYANPGGNSSVTVKMTIADGTITAVEVTPEAQGTSLQYQRKFVSGIAAEVVGKKLSEINVSKVAGSSLTSQGFNAALDEIKADASA
ncbi:hypothetical protein BH09ACT10_BH09ACT10_16900 [soil metagenome]